MKKSVGSLLEEDSAKDDVIRRRIGGVGFSSSRPPLIASRMINMFEAVVKHLEDEWKRYLSCLTSLGWATSGKATKHGINED